MVGVKKHIGNSMTDIKLPVELASGALTLDEIGAIFVLMCYPKLENNSFWDDHKKLSDIIDNFRQEGILTVNDDDKFELDLTWI